MNDTKHEEMMTWEKEKEKKRPLSETENYLRGYMIGKKLLQAEQYERKFFGSDESEIEALGELPLARAKMFEIRHFIMDMKNSDEKLLLYYHYIKGESVEHCGELLGISRSSAFRLKAKALAMAKEKLSGGNAV